MAEPKHIISLGAGVQSSTMALMAEHGEIKPKPTAAVFADTGAEPKSVYDWLDYLESKLSYPVYRVMHSNLRDDLIKATKSDESRVAGIPMFVTNKDDDVVGGMLWRQCTSEYKIKPVQKKLREIAGLKPRQRSKEVLIVQWYGISLDEITRMRESTVKWNENRYPLIDLGMKREHCLQWMAENNYPEPPRSACTFCPYHNDVEWRRLKVHEPEEFQDAVNIDRAIRNGITGMKKGNKAYLHRSMIPLEEVDLRNAEDHGQIDMFDNECEGMCGI
tara:strand:+ start:92 stop:916 length:825 start_codon:yes stop_codon:yes gene_type:complete